MSRLFKKIQNAPIKTDKSIIKESYSNINKARSEKQPDYKIIIGSIFFVFGSVMAYLIFDNIDCFYEAFSLNKTENKKEVVETSAVSIPTAPVVTKEEQKAPVKEEDATSLSQDLKTWMNKKLQNPMFQKENIANFVHELSGIVSEADMPIKDEIASGSQEHLHRINDFLKQFQIECVRIDGEKSRIQANGQSYMVNTFVSQYPRLRLSKITKGQIIFTDDNNQEYRKEISQYE